MCILFKAGTFYETSGSIYRRGASNLHTAVLQVPLLRFLR